MVELHTQILVGLVACLSRRNLEGVEVVAYFLHGPEGCLVGHMGVVAIHEAGGHSFTYIAIVGSAEEDMSVALCVVGVKIICSFGHAVVAAQLEAHRALAHDGLSAPGFTLGEVTACSFIINIESLVGGKLCELTARHGALLIDGAEIAPLLCCLEISPCALHHVEGGTRQVDVFKYIGAHSDVLRGKAIDGDGREFRTTGKSLCAKALDGEWQV